MKLWLALGLAAAVAGGLWYAHRLGYEAGKSEAELECSRQAEARKDEIIQLTRERDDAREAAEDLKADIAANTGEKIRESRQIADACADQPVEPDLLRVYTDG